MPAEELEYYPVEIGMYSNHKIRLVRGAFPREEQLMVYSTIHLLFDRIYGGKGYYVRWDEDAQILFCDDYGLDRKWLERVVSRCVEKLIFDASMYEKYNILTSEAILENYIRVGKRRWARRSEKTVIVADFLVVTPNTRLKLISVVDGLHMVNQNGETVDHNELLVCPLHTKESKVKERKEEPEQPVDQPFPDGEPGPTEISTDTLPGKMIRRFQTEYGLVMPSQEEQYRACENLCSWAQTIVNGSEGIPAEAFADLLMTSFSDLRKNDRSRSGFWREMPYLPKRLWQHRDQVLEHARSGMKEHTQSRRYDDIYTKLDAWEQEEVGAHE